MKKFLLLAYLTFPALLSAQCTYPSVAWLYVVDIHQVQHVQACADPTTGLVTWLIAPTTSALGNGTTVIDATASAGANAGAKISAALSVLTVTGGVVDARGFVGTQAITSAITLGGSVAETLILAPSVTYVCSVAPCIILASNGHLEGGAISGLPPLTAPPTYPTPVANSVIQLANGVNPGARGVIESSGFATLTGTTGAAGGAPSNFSVRNISVDGNRAANASGFGIALYAFQYQFDNVEVHSAASHGWWQELGSAYPAQTSVLVRMNHVKAHNNGADGFHDLGPTDQMWEEVEASTNGANGLNVTSSATSIGAGTSWFTKVDSYSNTADGFRDTVGAHVYNAQLGEGNTGCGLNILATGGGIYDVDAVHGNTLGGICVGAGGTAVTKSLVRGYVYTNTAGELILTNSGGYNYFDLNLIDFNTPVKHTVGSFATTDSYNLREGGGASGQLIKLYGGGTLTGATGMTNVNRLGVGGGTALTSGDFALSAEWGAGATIGTVLGTDMAGIINVGTGSGPSPNPTVTLTFKDGAWPSNVFCLANTVGGAPSYILTGVVGSAFTMTYSGTPAGTIAIGWHCFGE